MDGFEKINELFDRDYDETTDETYDGSYAETFNETFNETRDKITDEDYIEAFEEKCGKARKMLKDTDKVEKFLKRLEKKLQGLPVLSDTLVYIPQMGMMLNSYIRKQYTNVPVGMIAAILGCLLYFVAPIDLVPDLLPGIGYLDDAAMVGAALMLVKSDLDEYMEWRENSGQDEITTTYQIV